MRSTKNASSSPEPRAYRNRSRRNGAIVVAKTLVLIAAAILGVMTASCGGSSPPKRSGATAAGSAPQSASNRAETAPACRRATRDLDRGIVAVLNAAVAGSGGPVFKQARYVRVDNPPPGPPAPFLGGAYVVSAWVKLAGFTRLTWVVDRRMLITGKGAVLAIDAATREGSDPRARPSAGSQSRYADAIKNTHAYADARACVWDAS